jgi:uncharacterized protein YqfB (UPF0267 family)
MGLYNFHSRFVPMILSGHKTHTIRATRAHPDVPGKTLHLYTGLRQRGARLLKRVECTEVQSIAITEQQEVILDGNRLSDDECEQLARLDGFANFTDMMAFWNGRRPFVGQIIHWA